MNHYFRILLISLMLGMALAAAGCSNQSPETDLNQNQTAADAQTPQAADAESEADHDDQKDFEAFSEMLSKSMGSDQLYYEFELRVEGVSRDYYTVWRIEDQIRLDTFDQNYSIYANLTERTVYVYDRSKDILAPAEYDEALFTELMTPVAFNEPLDKDMFEHVHFEGSALMDGKPCDVYEVHAADLNVTYYLWKENGLTLKMIAQITGFPQYEYYFRSVQLNGVSADEVSMPKGIEVVKEKTVLPDLNVGP